MKENRSTNLISLTCLFLWKAKTRIFIPGSETKTGTKNPKDSRSYFFASVLIMIARASRLSLSRRDKFSIIVWVLVGERFSV